MINTIELKVLGVHSCVLKREVGETPTRSRHCKGFYDSLPL